MGRMWNIVLIISTVVLPALACGLFLSLIFLVGDPVGTGWLPECGLVLAGVSCGGIVYAEYRNSRLSGFLGQWMRILDERWENYRHQRLPQALAVAKTLRDFHRHVMRLEIQQFYGPVFLVMMLMFLDRFYSILISDVAKLNMVGMAWPVWVMTGVLSPLIVGRGIAGFRRLSQIEKTWAKTKEIERMKHAPEEVRPQPPHMPLGDISTLDSVKKEIASEFIHQNQSLPGDDERSSEEEQATDSSQANSTEEDPPWLGPLTF